MMIFGQLDRSHERGSVVLELNLIRKSLGIFAKYEIVESRQCMDEVTIRKDYSFFQALLKGVRYEFVKELRPSRRIFLKEDKLICHPRVAAELKHAIRNFHSNQKAEIQTE